MNKDGPIIVIEDDLDDLEVLDDVFKQLAYPNQVIYFKDGTTALDYLINSKDSPFLILSDINLPKLNGFELRDMVHNNEKLRLKCIPYLFFTTSVQQSQVIDAYSKSVQGFFTKPSSFSEIMRVIKNIVEYWKDCHSPNVIV
ncbi:MAG: histidine kinase [Flavisolibacter sp.]|jgi:CheY-like chemotaxis protein|nr:histidine kinase [Flavisolibacter sp.]